MGYKNPLDSIGASGTDLSAPNARHTPKLQKNRNSKIRVVSFTVRVEFWIFLWDGIEIRIMHTETLVQYVDYCKKRM